jgi:hypothetical protein
VSGAANRGPLVTLLAAALVGTGLLTADALTDPARTRAEAPAPVPAAAAAPAAVTTSATAPAEPSSTTTPPTAAPPTTAPPTTAPPTTAASATTTASADAYPSEAIYVGRDANRRISVAVAVRNGKAAAYLCDGKSLESWLTGTVSDATATVTAGSDRLVADLDAEWLDVSGTVRGRAVHIRAKLASEPAGLYRLSRTDGTTVGWIVQPDGSQVGLETQGDRFAPAPVYVPGQPITVRGQAAYPKEVSGDDRF